MKSIFNFLTHLSLRFRLITLILVLLVSVVGVVAITQLKQELLPPIELPNTFILAQVSGMSSEQALNILTKPIENELGQIPEIVNLETTTSGTVGSFISASNNFGLDQQKLRDKIQQALDRVWLPERRIQAPDGTNPQEFAAQLLGDLTPEILIYLAETNSNFLFQLSPDTWSRLSDDAVRTVLAYLAAQTEKPENDKTPLERLVDQELVPQLKSLPSVANVRVGGGQKLPDEADALQTADVLPTEEISLLLKLSPEVWRVVSAKAGNDLAELDQAAVDNLKQVPFEIPTTPPTLPESWQRDHFIDTSDLLEIRTLTQSLADIINSFTISGRMVGALGQTNDLTPEIVTQMLEIDPTMVEYFQAEHLVAMAPEVFAVLPDEFIANLDGFTRDTLAAARLAFNITGIQGEYPSVTLPSPWRIQPPQIITFSFADLPIAIFSIFSTGDTNAQAQANSPDDSQTLQTNTDNENTGNNPTTSSDNRLSSSENIPEGPALPPFFVLLGTQFGLELNTADDLINLELPADVADQFGSNTLSAANLLNFLILLGNPDSLPEGVPTLPIAINPTVIIGSLSPEAVDFIGKHDSTFLPSLSADVYEAFSDDVLALPNVAPPLSDVWNTLAEQPQFSQMHLETAKDVIELGNGQASSVLNTINETVPERFAGYDVRLFDSLNPALIRYFALNEPDFYDHLEFDVVAKLSPQVLANLPEAFLDSLEANQTEKLTAIAQGEQPSAAANLASLYTTDIPDADPNAPPINSDWGLVGDFYGIELDTADDFYRFPANSRFTDASTFMNSIFASPQGVNFAPNLFGGLTPDMVGYMLQRDPQVFDNVLQDALQLLPEETLQVLPQAVQERAQSTGEVFKPTRQITRTNGASSLLVTVLKKAEANTVESYHAIDDLITEIDTQNDNIGIFVAFEQSSFVEKSIEGVAREAGLGAVFAIIVILTFLSGGIWARSPRRAAGLIMMLISFGLLVLLTGSGLDAAGGDIMRAFNESDVVFRVLLLAGFVGGIITFIWPGNLPNPAWRSTLVIAVSIPLSVLMALAMMRWLPPIVNDLLGPAAENSPLITFILRLFPKSLTLNIMTLSGLTVSVGRVVDDSIVVLENIFRTIQAGGDKRQAILSGTRDVSLAIFSATSIAVVVFLPLGLTGGLVSEFFLPFGLAVTYALVASFIVAITVVPVLAYLLIDSSNIPQEHGETWMERFYLPVLKWSLGSRRNRTIVLAIALLSMLIGFGLMTTRPTTFIPSFGEPEINISVNMPSGTKILETNAKIAQFEKYIQETIPAEELNTVRTNVGGGGLSFESFFSQNSVNESRGEITLQFASSADLVSLARELRAEAETIFGKDNVTVSAGSLSDSGFGGFSVVVSGPQDVLAELDPTIIETLNNIDGLTNVSSNLSQSGVGSLSENGPVTYIRVNQESAISYSGELETRDTIGLTQRAIDTIKSLPNLPDTVTISQGFQSEIASSGFVGVIVAMGIAMVFVIIILIITFGSFIHWLDIILSVAVTPVGAAIALTVTNSTLGVSALIGLLMLIGIVVTNAVVLIDRVQSNRREQNLELYDALVEAGGRRVRPILMTALATMIALIPLAVGLSEGAIIASELGIVVIGGLFTSTLLTLIVVPAAYSLLHPLHARIARAVRMPE